MGESSGPFSGTPQEPGPAAKIIANIFLIALGLLIVAAIVWGTAACSSGDPEIILATNPTPTPTSVPTPMSVVGSDSYALSTPTRPPTEASATTPDAEVSTTPEFSAASLELLDLYQELLTFKDSPDFHYYCIDPSGPYDSWLNSVYSSSSDLDVWIQTGLHARDLQAMAVEYCQNLGNDTAKTRQLKAIMNPLWLSQSPSLPSSTPATMVVSESVKDACRSGIELRALMAVIDREGLEASGAELAKALVDVDDISMYVASKLITEPFEIWARDQTPENHVAMLDGFDEYIDICEGLIRDF